MRNFGVVGIEFGTDVKAWHPTIELLKNIRTIPEENNKNSKC